MPIPALLRPPIRSRGFNRMDVSKHSISRPGRPAYNRVIPLIYQPLAKLGFFQVTADAVNGSTASEARSADAEANTRPLAPESASDSAASCVAAASLTSPRLPLFAAFYPNEPSAGQARRTAGREANSWLLSRQPNHGRRRYARARASQVGPSSVRFGACRCSRGITVRSP